VGNAVSTQEGWAEIEGDAGGVGINGSLMIGARVSQYSGGKEARRAGMWHELVGTGAWKSRWQVAEREERRREG
jgi:hypothetical protein